MGFLLVVSQPAVWFFQACSSSRAPDSSPHNKQAGLTEESTGVTVGDGKDALQVRQAKGFFSLNAEVALLYFLF